MLESNIRDPQIEVKKVELRNEEGRASRSEQRLIETADNLTSLLPSSLHHATSQVLQDQAAGESSSKAEEESSFFKAPASDSTREREIEFKAQPSNISYCSGLTAQGETQPQSKVSVQSITDLMKLLKDAGQDKLVLNGQIVDISQLREQSMSVQSLKEETKDQSEIQPQSKVQVPALPPPTTAPSTAKGGFNFGMMMSNLVIPGLDFLGKTPNPIGSGSLIPNLNQVTPPALTLPKMVPDSPLTFPALPSQPMTLKPLGLPPPLMNPKDQNQNILRPSGRDQKQLDEVSQQRIESEPQSTQTQIQPKLKKSISDRIELINQSLIIDEKAIGGLLRKENISGSSTSFTGLRKRNEELEKLIEGLQREVKHLKGIQYELSNFVVSHFSQKSINQSIYDKGILEMLSSAQMTNAKVHLAFLFSSPLIKFPQKSQTPVSMQSIDYCKEFSGMLDGLSNSGMHITYMKVQATIEKLQETLTEGPIAIHFSGHGIRGTPSNNVGLNCLKEKPKGYLVLEDKYSQANFLPDTLLREILSSQGVKPEFVFVASCHSQFAGEIFHQAGAKHVICIQQNQTISDEASICFSQAFYKALFNQNRTVCQAFDIAKAFLASHPNKSISNEVFKFVLMRSLEEEQQDEADNLNPYSLVNPLFHGLNPAHKKQHVCRIFGPLKEGKPANACETKQPMFRVETSKIEDFIGRTLEMHSVITCILKQRVVNVMGIPGIGKTTLVKAVAHYLDERQAFKDGIIILSLRNLDQTSMIITRLEIVINKKLKETQNTNDEKIIMDKIVDFLSDKEVLLIMDNAETPSKMDTKNFLDFIQTLLDHCPKLRFLFTSRYNIGQFENNSEQVIELKELHMTFAVELLKKKASRKIEEREIQELLQIKPDRFLHSNPIKNQEEYKSLENHHMFEILKGHPHAISLAAPLLQNKKLKELYELLNSDGIINWLENEGYKNDPMGSLKVSMDISINQLQESEPNAIRLFWLIGLLPGGCTSADLDQLWGQSWYCLSEKLLRASLLVKKSISDENIYQLFPFMNQYAALNMDPEERLEYHDRIVNHLMVICKDLLSAQLDTRLIKLVSIETNIWACIYRMRETVIDQDEVFSVKRPRSPGYSSNNTTTIHQRTSTPSSSTVHKSYPATSSNKSDSNDNLSSNLTQRRKSQRIGGAQSALENRKKIQSSMGASSDSSESGAPQSHGIPQQHDNLSQYQYDVSQAMIDNYDSILSQRINLGLNKERSKSEKVPKYLRANAQANKVCDRQCEDEEEKEIQPSNSVVNRVTGFSSNDTDNEETQLFEEEEKKETSYMGQQPQSMVLSSHQMNLMHIMDDGNLTQNIGYTYYHNNDHPDDQSFSESMIEPQAQLPLLTRQSSVEGSQRFQDLLVQPSNQQTYSLNNSYSNGINAPHGSNLQQAKQSQILNQSFRQELFQNQLFSQQNNNRNRFQNDYGDQISVISGGAQYQQPSLMVPFPQENYDTISNDSLMQQINNLNTSTAYPYQNQQQISFLNQSFNTDNSMMLQSSNSKSRINQWTSNRERPAILQEQAENIPEAILEESICEENDQANASTHQQLTLSTPLRSTEKQQEADEEVVASLEDEKQSQKSSDKHLSNETDDCSIEDNDFIFPAAAAQIAAEVEEENLDQSFTEEDMKAKKALDDQEYDLFEKLQNHSSMDPQGGDLKLTISSLKKNKPSQSLAPKRVTIQENPQVSSQFLDEIKESDDAPISLFKSKGSKLQPPTVISKVGSRNIQQEQKLMTRDGALIIYYITNLLIMAKFDDSVKVIEQCENKFEGDKWCYANLIKLRAYALEQKCKQSSSSEINYEDVKELYEKAMKQFEGVKSSLGQAICQFALGLLFHSHKEHFVTKKLTENKLVEQSKKHFEEAIKLYAVCKHFTGEAQCHRILSNIKGKGKEYYMDHVKAYKCLMIQEKQLQTKNQSNFIIINGSLDGIEASLYLEIVGSPLQQSSMIPLKETYRERDLKSSKAFRLQEKSSRSNKRIKDVQSKANAISPMNPNLTSSQITSKQQSSAKLQLALPTVANIQNVKKQIIHKSNQAEQNLNSTMIKKTQQPSQINKKMGTKEESKKSSEPPSSAKKYASKKGAHMVEIDIKEVVPKNLMESNIAVLSQEVQSTVEDLPLASQRSTINKGTTQSNLKPKKGQGKDQQDHSLVSNGRISSIPSNKPQSAGINSIPQSKKKEESSSKKEAPAVNVENIELEFSSDTVFEKASDFNLTDNELLAATDSQQSKEASEKTSTKKANRPQTAASSQNVESESKPQWRNFMRQSQSQVSLQQQQTNGTSKTAPKSLQQVANSQKQRQAGNSPTSSLEQQATSQQRMKQIQFFQNRQNQSSASSLSQATPKNHSTQAETQAETSQQSQFVSFNITTTTTVKIEGQVGQIPPNLVFGQNLHVGGAGGITGSTQNISSAQPQ